MKKVLVPLAAGFEEIEAISIIDVLRRAEIEVLTVSLTNELKAKGSHDIVVECDALLSETDSSEYDMIVLPGGMPGATNLNEHLDLKTRMLYMHANGKWLGAICAAPMVLGDLKLLKNKNATCYPGFEQYLTGAEVKGSSVEVANQIITGKGAGVAIEFALKIVEVLIGTETARELGKKMVLPSYN